LEFDLLTHIAVFDFSVSTSGAITNPSGWPWTDVINTAHNNGTKVIMTVTNFNASEIHQIITNNTVKNTLFNNLKTVISTYALDGVNIDFEGLNVSDRGTNINTFMAELTNFIHTELPGKEVSFDGPAVNWSGWNLDVLTQNVDYLIIMAYDYNGSWSNNTGAVAPLIHPSNGISVTKSLNVDYNVPKSKYPEKLILGVPYYGKQWTTSTGEANASVIDYIKSTFYRDAVLEANQKGGFIWDSNSETPWYKWQSNGWNQVWQDNEQSIGKKYDLAIAENLGGIGIWALNYDGESTELWSLIQSKFDSQLAVGNSDLSKSIQLYPNPVNGTLKINNSSFANITTIKVFNRLGQELNVSFRNNEIELNHLENGIYFVKIEDNNGSNETYKILKSN
jgi:spore germination protein YaaH